MLLDPTDCFAGLTLGYRLRAIPLFVRPSQKTMGAILDWETRGVGVDPVCRDFMQLAGGEFNGTKLIFPKQVRDTIDVPTSLVLAGRSRAHKITAVAAGAQKHMPQLDITTLPDVSHHTLPMDGAAKVASTLV